MFREISIFMELNLRNGIARSDVTALAKGISSSEG
jgi:hypothetical protein